MELTYTWAAFQTAVLNLLPADKNRLGPVAATIALWTRLAVIEIQNFIPQYRAGHETLYLASDFVGEGYASVSSTPPGAMFRDAYLVLYKKDHTGVVIQKPSASCTRTRLEPVAWLARMDLVHGRVPGDCAFITIGPEVHSFYVYPSVKDGQAVSIFWSGIKSEFNAQELTPFDTQMTLVVADWVKSRLAREVDKDLPLAADYMTSYKTGRAALYLLAREKGSTK
jgi:hypothetical protein